MEEEKTCKNCKHLGEEFIGVRRVLYCPLAIDTDPGYLICFKFEPREKVEVKSGRPTQV